MWSGCLQHSCQHVASGHLQLQPIHLTLVLRGHLAFSVCLNLAYMILQLAQRPLASLCRLTGCKESNAFCRYKPDEVLISDHLAFASKFAAMAARKLTPDSKRANVAGIELHALLQVSDSFHLLHNNIIFSLKSCLWCTVVHRLFSASQFTVAA